MLSGKFAFAYHGSQDHSGKTTADLTSPPLCSGGPLHVTFDYFVAKANSQLHVLTQCGGGDGDQGQVYSTVNSAWQKGSLTLQPCPHSDTRVGTHTHTHRHTHTHTTHTHKHTYT